MQRKVRLLISAPTVQPEEEEEEIEDMQMAVDEEQQAPEVSSAVYGLALIHL